MSGAETVLKAKGGSYGSIANFNALALNDGLEITKPAEATFVENVGIVANGTLVANEWVTISKPVDFQTYRINIAGIWVSTENQEDVLGDGTVSFDPETNTLTLMNANITPAENDGISSALTDLQIRLIGQNYIAPEYYYACMDMQGTGTKGTIVFYGGGSLELKSPSVAFKTQHDLVLTDGVKVSAESMNYSAIAGEGTSGGGGATILPSITMSGEETVLMAKSGDRSHGSLVSFYTLTLNDGLTIGLPEGATFSSVRGIINADGTLVANEWVVIASQDFIDVIQTPSSSPSKGEGIYNLAGQKVGDDYKGIVIIDGKKFLRK